MDATEEITPPQSSRNDALFGCAVIAGFAAFTCHRLWWLHATASVYPFFFVDFAATCALAVALCFLLLFRRDLRFSGAATGCMGAGLGLMFYILVLGSALTDPRNVGWLLDADWAQHFLGWQFYRQAAWAWPPGTFDTFWFPVGTAVAYTDSLPLLAMPLKLFNSLLPARFQYIGFWLLVNCVLQGCFGALLTRCFSRSIAVQTLGALLFLVSPIFIARLGHDTLTTQWLLLAALWLYFRKNESPRNALLWWIALAAIAALAHPYLSAMLLPLMAAYYAREVHYSLHYPRYALYAAHFAAAVLVTIVCWWLSGIFSVPPSGGGIELGYYNANLLSWFDSQQLSRWIPQLPRAGAGQGEGFGYLGLGMFLLCALALPFIPHARAERKLPPLMPLLVITALLTLIAFSVRITLGGHEILRIVSHHFGILGVFRGSGRFMWPSVYLITTLAIAVITIRSQRLALVAFGLACIVQFAEIAPLHIFRMQLRLPHDTGASLLHDEYWAQTVQGRRHITYVLPPACGAEAAPWLPFSLLAADHGMTINAGYVARFDEPRTFAYCEQLKRRLADGVRDADTLYVVRKEEVESFLATSSTPMQCTTADGYVGCVVASK